MTNEQFTLTNGRTIGVTAFGDPLAKRLVVFCAPSPGSSDFDPEPTTTNTWGVHLIALDRPGYGGSEILDASEPETVQGFADDIARRLELMGSIAEDARRSEMLPVGVVGWGFGAAVALSLSARHPALIDSVVVVDPRSPKELRNENAALVLDISAARYATGVEELAAGLNGAARSPLQWLGISPDEPMLEVPGLRNRLERMVTDSAENGMRGLASDITAAQEMSWGEDLSAITAPVTVIFSDEDERRRRDAHWLARKVTSATTVRAAGCGSLPIVGVWPSILHRIAPNHGDVPAAIRGSLFEEADG